MDKRSKILITVFFIAILISIFFTYKRAFLDKNFTIVEEEILEEETMNEEATEEGDMTEEEVVEEEEIQ